MYKMREFPFELLFWCAALVSLFLLSPSSENHYSLCPLYNLGFDWCPGCGLGRAMHLLALGEFELSWSLHPLAGFAWIVIIFRIVELIKHFKTTTNYG